jgi:hypothetical protein
VRHLKEVHGIEFEEKTLANRNAAGLEPLPEYLGTIPYYRVDKLDAWADTAFTSESPVAVTRRKAAGMAAQERRKAKSQTKPAPKARARTRRASPARSVTTIEETAP